MIESIHFTNFKALRDATLPLSPCTLIIGPNGSGKSTVLQALEVFSQKHQFKFEDVASASLRDDPKADCVEVTLKWGEPYVGAWSNRRWQRGSRTGVAGVTTPNANAGDCDRLLSSIRVHSFDAKVLAKPVPLQKNMQLDRDGAGFAGVLTRLQDQDRKRFDALAKEFTGWLPEFDQILFDMDERNQRLLQLQTRDGGYTIAACDVSQGTLLALAMLTLAYLPEPPSLIGLEEPDRGIHPRLLRRVQDAMYRVSHPESCGEKREPVQIIATTHSPYFLDLFKDHPEEVVIANKTGLDVTFQRLSDQPRVQEILEDAQLGDIWYTGILGGVPSEP